MRRRITSRWLLTAAAFLAAAVGGVLLLSLVISGEELSHLLLVAALLVAVVLATAAAVAVWTSRRPARAVDTLTDALRRIEAGDLDHRIVLPDSDELRELGAAFNRTAESVRTIIGDLEAERNKLAAVLETMADGVMVVDESDEVVLINKAGRQLTELPGVIAGTRLRDHELQHLVETCRRTNARQQMEVQLIRGRRVLSATATPLHDAGRVEVLLTLHDLTPIRRIETTRREFVTNVSHELRSPLASIKAMVETLENGALADRTLADDFLGRIRREVDRMHAMVTDLLELARVESGQAELGRQSVDLAELAAEVVATAHPRAQSKGISLEVNRDTGLAAVQGDAGKLRQVIDNLVDNALKFTPAGGRVTVDVRNDPAGVRVTVTDTGVGIAEEHVPHVFERFYKVDRSRRDTGVGLGLAIVNHIVRAHQGTLHLVSNEGEGSSFSFTIPASKQPAAP